MEIKCNKRRAKAISELCLKEGLNIIRIHLLCKKGKIYRRSSAEALEAIEYERNTWIDIAKYYGMDYSMGNDSNRGCISGEYIVLRVNDTFLDPANFVGVSSGLCKSYMVLYDTYKL